MDQALIHIRKLDSVLRFMNNMRDKELNQYDINQELQRVGHKITVIDLFGIISKLLEDKNIEYSHIGLSRATSVKYENHYIISFKGKLLIEKGGYEQEYEDEKLKRYVKFLEKLTLIVLTTATAVLAFIDIVLKLSKCCGCHE